MVPEEDEEMKNGAKKCALFFFFVGVESVLGIFLQVHVNNL